MAHTPYKFMEAQPAPVEKTETPAAAPAAETVKPAKPRREKRATKK